MRTWAIALCVHAAAGAGLAEQVVREYSWAKLFANGAPAGVEVVAKSPGRVYDVVRISGPAQEPLFVTLLTIERPPITWPTYAILGMVRCENVNGAGYLEVWSHFQGGGAYYSITSADAGPRQRIEGTCGWRPFVLPFCNGEGASPPEKLVFNVSLPAGGTVYLGPLRLAQYRPGEDPVALAAEGTGWWSDRAAGLFGGIGGGLVGCLGALIGILGGRGKARRFVLGALVALIAFGIAMVLLGLAALAFVQPYAVWYPPLLLGILCTAIPGGLYHQLRRRYGESRPAAARARCSSSGPSF
jgi:hypothetical protein